MGVDTSRPYLFVALLLLAFFCQCEGQRGPVQRAKAKQREQPATCSKNEFTCGNKKCVPLSALCNGTSECADGKDEAADQCLVIKTGVCTNGGEAKSFCDDSFDGAEEQNGTHQFLCQSETVRKNGSVSLACFHGVWTPTTTLCTRVCQPMVIPTTNITCLRNGKEVNCSQPLLIGTKISAQCRPSYIPSESEILCQANGTWSRTTIDCIPECGRQLKEKSRNTSSMRSVEYREFPWSATIYYTKPGTSTPLPIQGTIISPYLVVTTAINFDPEYRQEVLKPDSTIVIVAKRTKDPDVTDDQFQKTYQVRDIYFTDKGYQESDNSSSSENIVIIELKEKIILSPSVYPVCVNWAKNETLYPNKETLGQVPHIVSSVNGNASEHEVLQTIALHYVNRVECLSSDTMKNTPQVVRTDNFCSEPSTAPGDGAFIFQEPTTNLFYIQGLVDGVTPSESYPPAITNTYVDLSAHIDWMKAVRKHTEDRFVSEMWLQVESADQTVICKKNFTSKDNSSLGLRSGFGDDEQSNITDGCKLPDQNQTNASNVTISCDSSVTESDCQKIRENESTVPEFTMLRIECENGYGVGSNKEVVCFKSKWTPPITPCKGSTKPSSVGLRPNPATAQKPAIRKPGTSPKPGSNQNQPEPSATQNNANVNQRRGNTLPRPPAGKPVSGAKKPGNKQPVQTTSRSDADQPSSSALPDQIDYGEVPDQDVSPSSPRPVYIRPGGSLRAQNQPTQQPDSQVDDGYNPTSQQPSIENPGYVPAEEPNQIGDGDQNLSPSSQRPLYRRPTQPSSQSPTDYNDNQLGYSTSQQSPVNYGGNQGLGYGTSQRPVNRRPGIGSPTPQGNGFTQPARAINQDYGDVHPLAFPTYPQPYYGDADTRNQGYTPSSLQPVNRRPATGSQTQPGYNPYGQQQPVYDTTGPNYNSATQSSANEPVTEYQTNANPGLRGSFDLPQQPSYVNYGYVVPEAYSPSSEKPPYQVNSGSVRGQVYYPTSQRSEPEKPASGAQLPAGYEPQLPFQGNNGGPQSRGYRPSQQRPYQSGAGQNVGGSSPRPVLQPGKGSQALPGYAQPTKQNGIAARQDFNYPSEETPYEGVGTGFGDYVTTQDYNSPSTPYDLGFGDIPNTQDPLAHQSNQPSSFRPQLQRGSSSCSSEGFFPILNDCTHFYRCVPSGAGFSKYVFPCGPGTVWDSDMNTCNHAWAVQRPDCRQSA